MISMTYHLKEPTSLIMYSRDYIVAVCMQCAIRCRNCESKCCIDMQMNVEVDAPVAVVHGATFDLFACAMNFVVVKVAVYETHLCPINDVHVI